MFATSSPTTLALTVPLGLYIYIYRLHGLIDDYSRTYFRDELVWNCLLFHLLSSFLHIMIIKVLSLFLQSFSIIKSLVDNTGRSIGSSYFQHWVSLVEIFFQVIVFPCCLLMSSTICADALSSLIY